MRHADDNSASHSHGLSRSRDVVRVSDARLLWAVLANQALTAVQVVAGFTSGSAALLSDAAHNFNDANTLLIAYVARRIARRRANERYTFGYRRAEMIGATINLTLLAAIGLYLIYEGIQRFVQPVEIIGWIMAAASLLALVVDLATVWLLWAMSRGSLNVTTALAHNLADAFGSLAVLIGAGAIIWLDWMWVDPILTLLIAGYVLWQVARLLPQATRVLMEGAPAGLKLSNLVRGMESLEGVKGAHHVHVWELDEHHRALEAHVVIDRDQAEHLEEIKRGVKRLLRDEYHIQHSTLEFEYSDSSAHDCDDKSVIPEH